MNLPSWLTDGFWSFDLETTNPNPYDARIVSVALLEMSAKGVGEQITLLVNPGVPIPPEATAIHGITDAMASVGIPAPEAIRTIGKTMTGAWKAGRPVVVFNAPFDLTVFHHEVRRHFPKATGLVVGAVLDPMIIDRATSKRKGKRTLEACSEFYGVKKGQAHNAADDALVSARILWKQVQKNADLRVQSLQQMQTWQEQAHQRDVARFRDWLREQLADPRNPERELRERQLKSTNTGWPVRNEDEDAAAANDV